MRPGFGDSDGIFRRHGLDGMVSGTEHRDAVPGTPAAPETTDTLKKQETRTASDLRKQEKTRTGSRENVPEKGDTQFLFYIT